MNGPVFPFASTAKASFAPCVVWDHPIDHRPERIHSGLLCHGKIVNGAMLAERESSSALCFSPALCTVLFPYASYLERAVPGIKNMIHMWSLLNPLMIKFSWQCYPVVLEFTSTNF